MIGCTVKSVSATMIFHKELPKPVKFTVSQKGPTTHSGMSFQWRVEAAKLNDTHSAQESKVLGQLTGPCRIHQKEVKRGDSMMDCSLFTTMDATNCVIE